MRFFFWIYGSNRGKVHLLRLEKSTQKKHPDSGSTIRTLLHGKIKPKDWQVLSLGYVGFLLFLRVVSGDYGKPRDFFETKMCAFQSFIPQGKKTPPRFRGRFFPGWMFFSIKTQAEDTAEMIKSGALAFFVKENILRENSIHNKENPAEFWILTPTKITCLNY